MKQQQFQGKNRTATASFGETSVGNRVTEKPGALERGIKLLPLTLINTKTEQSTC